MDTKQIRQINVERLGNWTHKMVSSHATPMLLIGVGHDHVSGKRVICTLEDMRDDVVTAFLLETANQFSEAAGFTVLPKAYLDKLMYLVSFLGILVHRAGGNLTIEHLSEVAGHNFALGINLDPDQDRVTLVREMAPLDHNR